MTRAGIKDSFLRRRYSFDLSPQKTSGCSKIFSVGALGFLDFRVIWSKGGDYWWKVARKRNDEHRPKRFPFRRKIPLRRFARSNLEMKQNLWDRRDRIPWFHVIPSPGGDNSWKVIGKQNDRNWPKRFLFSRMAPFRCITSQNVWVWQNFSRWEG